MNLSRLFETQAALDARIFESHPELKGQDNLDWKVLALQVELGECANEWRGFKKWSNDQEPRTFKRVNCPACEKKGFVRGKPPVDPVKGKHGLGNHWYYCDDCAGYLVVDKNPLLEEYVDCLHFFLSIGLVFGADKWMKIEGYPPAYNNGDITGQFLDVQSRSLRVLEEFLAIELPPVAIRCLFTEAFESFLQLGAKLGFTWEQIEAAYYAKNEVNHQRQESGY